MSLVPGRLELQVEADHDPDSALTSREGPELKVRFEESQRSGQCALPRDRVGDVRQPGRDPRRLVTGEGLPVKPPAALLALDLPADHVPAEPLRRVILGFGQVRYG